MSSIIDKPYRVEVIDMEFDCDHIMQPIPWDSETMGSRQDCLIALKCLKCGIVRTEVERIV